ncbi:MAG: hypothetical protein ACN6O2_04010 [Stenotrophomonas sp.]
MAAGKLPFINVINAAVHTEIASISLNLGVLDDGIGTIILSAAYFAESPTHQRFSATNWWKKGLGKLPVRIKMAESNCGRAHERNTSS